MPTGATRQQRTETVARLYDGKLKIERRNGSPNLTARAFLQGKSFCKSTGEQTLGAVSKVATNWYLAQLERLRTGKPIHGTAPLFSDVVDKFLVHVEQQAEVSAGQIDNLKDKWTLLQPLFTGTTVTDVDTRFLLTLRDQRSRQRTSRGTFVKPATIKKI